MLFFSIGFIAGLVWGGVLGLFFKRTVEEKVEKTISFAEDPNGHMMQYHYDDKIDKIMSKKQSYIMRKY